MQNNQKGIHLLSANMDIVFISTGLDSDFNLRRIEGYIILVSKSGANSVISLNKANLCSDCNNKLKEVKGIA